MYINKNTEDVYETIDEAVTEAVDEAVYNGAFEEYYADMLDDCYGEIEICGLSYAPSIALERVDPIAYNCGMNDFADSVWSDVKYDLEHNGYVDMYGIEIEEVDEATE